MFSGKCLTQTSLAANPNTWSINSPYFCVDSHGFQLRTAGSLVQQALPTAQQRPPTSQLLKDILDRAPSDSFTLSWLAFILHERSFGIIMLFLGVLATVPVGSTVPGLVLSALAVQMIAGRTEPVFPRFITSRRLPTKRLLRLGEFTLPILVHLEKVIHPRWPAAIRATSRLLGLIILLLTAVLLLTPVPLSNIVPATLIAFIALAYIEEDGLVLSCALLLAVCFIAAASAAVWGTIAAASFIGHLW
jgi:hypothetical protein